MLFLTSVFVVVASMASSASAAALDLHSANGLSLRGHMEANLREDSNSSQSSLKALSSSCKCSFSGLCSCVQALEFMKCIRDACDSGACDCGTHHYFYACHSMAGECPTAELQCGRQEAKCKKVPPMVTESSMELITDIEVMQVRKCKLKDAVADGFINGKVRIAEIDPEIQDRTEELTRKGIATPKLGCEEQDTESFAEFKADLTEQMEKEQAEVVAKVEKKHADKKLRRKHVEKESVEVTPKEPSARNEEESSKANKDEKSSAKEEDSSAKEHPMWRKKDSPWRGEEDMPKTDAELANRVFGTGQGVKIDAPTVAVKTEDTAWLTSRTSTVSANYRENWLNYVLIGLVNLLFAAICAWIYDKYRFRAKMPFAPKATAVEPLSQDDFGVGLFSCLSDIKLTLFACCCPCLRWADTLDRAGLLKYWVAFTVFAVLAILSPYTFGISGVVLAVVCFRYRQKLRKKFNLEPNNGQDFLAYLCCGTCAVVQEARVEANRIK